MSDTDVLQGILTEVAVALRSVEPLARGLAMVRAANLSPSARAIVDEVFAVADGRRAALQARRERLQLLADGPDLYAPIAPQTVAPSVLAELQQHANAIRAAIGVLTAA